jgi:putative hemolysin
MPSSGVAAPGSNARSAFGVREFFAASGLMEKFLPFGQVHDLYARARESKDGNLFEALLAEMKVSVRIAEAEISRIPATGAVLVVCNRPFGILDAAVLGAVLHRVRPDVKILTDIALRDIEGLREHCICVDPFAAKEAVEKNAAALLRCVRWLLRGGLLVTFPATGVPQLPLTRGPAANPEWDSSVARLARLTGAATLPVAFQQKNSAATQALSMMHPGLVHPTLRPALLLNEFLAQKGRTVQLRVGRAIPLNTPGTTRSDAEATHYLRWRTYLLAQPGPGKNLASVLRPLLPKQGMDRLTRPIAAEALLSDVENLRPDQILDDSREFTVFAAREHEIPNILPELGRLRELTFREAGEGTGRSTDLDTFDRYYTHIVLWSKQNQEPVGAYRIGKTQDILPLRGLPGLYTSTLFRFDERFFGRLGPALELGRSFVRPEYQRQYAPLLLLWKGIARYVASHPETPVLFGAVSISGRYTRSSRELIVRFFEARNSGDELSPLVQPRRAFRPGLIRSWDCRSICHAMRELDQIADPIADMESDGKGIPILIKHYSRLGGRLIGFNVDAKFSNVLDGLVVMDLRRTQPSSLERYMGKSGLAAFRRYHGLPALHEQY